MRFFKIVLTACLTFNRFPVGGAGNRLQDALIVVGLSPSGVWHLAAFLGGLPSKRQEIDDKLPSNSSSADRCLFGSGA
jgi:hypothetical protein